MKPLYIVVHCSASRWGDAATIDAWHLTRPDMRCHIGYHAVILNGMRYYDLRYEHKLDGKLEPGRPETQVGAHCRAGGMNLKSLGVCLIGTPCWDGYPTARQLAALVHYCTVKCKQYGIKPERIIQHSDADKSKPLCASIDLKLIREKVKRNLQAG